jgi:hypothetical protein
MLALHQARQWFQGGARSAAPVTSAIAQPAFSVDGAPQNPAPMAASSVILERQPPDAMPAAPRRRLDLRRVSWRERSRRRRLEACAGRSRGSRYSGAAIRDALRSLRLSILAGSGHLLGPCRDQPGAPLQVASTKARVRNRLCNHAHPAARAGQVAGRTRSQSGASLALPGRSKTSLMPPLMPIPARSVKPDRETVAPMTDRGLRLLRVTAPGSSCR